MPEAPFAELDFKRHLKVDLFPTIWCPGCGIGGSEGPPPSTRSSPSRTASRLIRPPSSGTRFTSRRSASSAMSAYWPSLASMQTICS